MMTLEDFITKYDHPGSIVLLEGKREVPENEQALLTKLGQKLASSTKHITFRSGNATGADYYFSSGVCEVDPMRLENIIPYTGHRSNKLKPGRSYSLDDAFINPSSELVKLSRLNQKTENLMDRYLSGERNQYTYKAAYILRDTVKVLGLGKIPPANFGIFYDDLKNPRSGGTGHTVNTCKVKNVPAINQKVWFDWL